MGQVANYYGTVGDTTSQLTSQLSQLGQGGSKAAADVNESLGVSKRFYQTMGAGVVSNEGKTSHFKTTKVITEELLRRDGK